MKTLIIILFALALFTLNGCGSSSNTDSKNLFSLWTSDTTTLDLRGLSFGTNPYDFFFEGGTQCACDLTLIGVQAQGSYAINNCYAVAYGNDEMSCNALAGTGNYVINGVTLTTTTSTGTVTNLY